MSSCEVVGRGREMWKPLTSLRLFFLKIGADSSQIVLSPVRCSKLRLTTGVNVALCRDEFRVSIVNSWVLALIPRKTMKDALKVSQGVRSPSISVVRRIGEGRAAQGPSHDRVLKLRSPSPTALVQPINARDDLKKLDINQDVNKEFDFMIFLTLPNSGVASPEWDSSWEFSERKFLEDPFLENKNDRINNIDLKLSKYYTCWGPVA
ncbi:hypothetical protein TNCV_3594621 [Trichonephila clavipes]|nr:hypothetical protein TNCV_3594621 [Trichonephila clavipes]